jgi:hypothetical protein
MIQPLMVLTFHMPAQIVLRFISLRPAVEGPRSTPFVRHCCPHSGCAERLGRGRSCSSSRVGHTCEISSTRCRERRDAERRVDTDQVGASLSWTEPQCDELDSEVSRGTSTLYRRRRKGTCPMGGSSRSRPSCGT